MNLFLRSRLLPTAAVVLLFLPALSRAQSAAGVHTAASPASSVVSVRELSIPSRARDAFDEGSRRLAKTDFLHSAEQFQRAIAKFAGYYEAYFYLGITDLNLGRVEDAEKAFQKSLELSSGRYAQADFGMGMLLCDRNSFADAAAAVEKGLQLDGDSWFGYYAQARAMFGLDRLEDAEKSAREALARNADLAAAYLLLADVHSQENSTVEVLQDLDKYIALDPDGETRAKAEGVRENIRKALSRESSAAAPQP